MNQTPSVDGRQQPITVVVDKFKSIVTSQSGLYSGADHNYYNESMTGTAYFETNDWQTGNVSYDGVLYKNVPMKYDLVRDKLMILQMQRPLMLYIFPLG